MAWIAEKYMPRLLELQGVHAKGTVPGPQPSVNMCPCGPVFKGFGPLL